MTNGLYKRPDVELPYNIDTRYFTYNQEGSIKEKYKRKWVENKPSSIKAFCTNCVNHYGYSKDKVTIHCNPVADEPRVMCENPFTSKQEEKAAEKEIIPRRGIQPDYRKMHLCTLCNSCTRAASTHDGINPFSRAFRSM